jgi:hypothetical protein
LPQTPDAPDPYDPATSRVPAESVLFSLLLKPLPGSDIPPEVRLRRGLKLLKRSCGLQCLAAREVAPGPENAPAAPGTPGTGTVARADQTAPSGATQ